MIHGSKFSPHGRGEAMNQKKKIVTSYTGFGFIIILCIVGILSELAWGYKIDMKMPNNLYVGNLFEILGSYLSYCMYPAAGMCLFKGVYKANKLFGIFLAGISF